MIEQEQAAYQAWVADAPVRFQNHADVRKLHEHCLRVYGHLRIAYCEFGVRSGTTFRWWVEGNQHPKSRFFGFDSFHGLPESWDSLNMGTLPAGTFTQNGRVPQVFDPRAWFYAGWFEQTVPPFFSRFKWGPPLVVHLDCDLYSSAQTVFRHLKDHWKPGDLLIMDEAGQGGEFTAFQEAGIDAEPVAAAGCAVAAVVR